MNLEAVIGSFVPLILLGIIFGFLCRYFANLKGKRTTEWFWWGFFFSTLAFVILAALPSEKVEAEIAELREEIQALKDRL
jgi:predicted membrane-bound dolichyl-phosphate-mannose-protein mannosyltransferase